MLVTPIAFAGFIILISFSAVSAEIMAVKLFFEVFRWFWSAFICAAWLFHLNTSRFLQPMNYISVLLAKFIVKIKKNKFFIRHEYVGMTKKYVATTKKYVAATNNYLAATNNCLAATKKYVAVTKNSC